MRGGGCRHGSGVLWVRGSDCWAAAVVADTVVADTVVADTVVGAATRRLREGYEGTNVGGVVLVCASALVGIFMIVCSAGLYVNNRDLAAHGVRTQGQVVEADASGSDMVVYTVGGTDYQVPAPEVGDRLPGEAVTVVYDPRDPAISNLEDDWRAWTSHWVFLGFGLFLLGWPAMPVVAGVFEADGPVVRRLARARPARRQPGTPPTPPGPSDREPPPARQALPEPYVPGSGDRVPAELRLVLAGYVGIACGLFATALACATAFAFHFRLDGPVYGLLFSLAVGAFAGGGWRGGWGCGGRSRYPIFQAASAAQRSTHGHGDGLEAWRAHTDT